MKKSSAILTTLALLLCSPFLASAATNCDEQAKPALACPTGYSMMCIPTGGDHWGCGKEGAAGGVEEAPPMQGAGTLSAPAPATEPAVAAPSTAPAEKPVQTPPAPPQAVLEPGTAPAGEPSNDLNDVNRREVPPPSEEGPDLEDAQEMLVAAAERAPEALAPILETVAWTLGAVAALFGLWEWVKRMREKKSGTCGRCGETKGGPVTCQRCDGTGKIEEEHEATVKCAHCKGSGIDPCHHCGGTGKMSMPNPPQSEQELEGWPPCDFCGGSGLKKIGAGRDMGEANDAVKNGQFSCCFCHGKKETTATLKREASCPDCKGAGKK